MGSDEPPARPPKPTQTQPPTAYLMQYTPSLGWLIMKKVGPARARAVSSGKNGYDVVRILTSGGGGGGGGSQGGAGANAEGRSSEG